MSGLIDAVEGAIRRSECRCSIQPCEHDARAAVLAVADWLHDNVPVHANYGCADVLRSEVAPPPPPTPEDVIREWMAEAMWEFDQEDVEHIAAALRDAGMLRAEPDPHTPGFFDAYKDANCTWPACKCPGKACAP